MVYEALWLICINYIRKVCMCVFVHILCLCVCVSCTVWTLKTQFTSLTTVDLGHTIPLYCSVQTISMAYLSGTHTHTALPKAILFGNKTHKADYSLSAIHQRMFLGHLEKFSPFFKKKCSALLPHPHSFEVFIKRSARLSFTAWFTHTWTHKYAHTDKLGQQKPTS